MADKAIAPDSQVQITILKCVLESQSLIRQLITQALSGILKRFGHCRWYDKLRTNFYELLLLKNLVSKECLKSQNNGAK